MRSVGELAPSAVVLKTNRPGMSLVLGVPSTSPLISAAGTKFVPSLPMNPISPSLFPEDTATCDPVTLLVDLESKTWPEELPTFE
jgi:hypothetical protein